MYMYVYAKVCSVTSEPSTSRSGRRVSSFKELSALPNIWEM